jgi:hypothetical protein
MANGCRYGRSDRPAEMSQPASANGPICNTSVMAYDVATVVQFIFANRGISQVIPPYSMCLLNLSVCCPCE